MPGWRVSLVIKLTGSRDVPSKEQAEMAESLIIEELVDLAGPLGFVYEKRADGPCPAKSYSDVFLFFARCSSRFSVKAPKSALGGTASEPLSLDTYVVAVMPAHSTLKLTGETAIADGVTLIPKPELLEAVGSAYKVPVRARFEAVAALTILPRTNWLNEVMHRYVFERTVAGNRNNAATDFLEAEIVKEIYFRLSAEGKGARANEGNQSSEGRRAQTLRRAMDFIEANLFRATSVREIALRSGVSESTLLREFQRKLGTSPQTYIVGRRLEEAMILVKSLRYRVGEVSDMVGYENVSAFSAAFKKRFGVSPSAIRGAWRGP